MTGECDNELERVWTEVRESDFASDISDIRKLLDSANSENCLRGLIWMRRWIQERGVREEFFELAEACIEDSNSHCRWQSLIVIGAFIESDVERVWPVIEKYAISEDDDMRTAVATVLLEHVFEHYTRYDSRVTELARTYPLFADTLSRCSDFREKQGSS